MRADKLLLFTELAIATYWTTADMAQISKEESQETQLMRAMRQVHDFKRYLTSLGIKVSVRTARVHYKERQPCRKSRNILAAIDEITKSNDKMTAQHIQLKIEEDLGVSLSLSSVRHARRLLGRKTPFSQMTEEMNSDARLQRVLQRIESGEIWDDGTEVPEQDDRPQPGRVIKLHIWGMISQHDACPKTILHEILDKRRFQKPNQVAAARLGLDDGFCEETDPIPAAAAAEPSALKHIKLVVIAVAKDN